MSTAAPTGCTAGPPGPPPEGVQCPGGLPAAEAERELRNILGLDEPDVDHPLEAYDIGCDQGDWNDFLRKMWCGAQGLPFALGKWTVGLGIGLMGWALEFRVADALTPVAASLSRTYESFLVGPLGLVELAWTVALLVAGWHLLRARAARGLSEIATTFLIAVVGTIVLANPQGYLEGAITLAQNTSGAVLQAVDATVQDSNTAQDSAVVRDRLAGVLRSSFVAEPYDLINWGEPLTGECAAARDEILDGGPWGSDDEPRDIMRGHGCDRQADYNAEPTDSRAIASLIVALAAGAATVLLATIALAVLVAQITLIAAFAGARLVFAIALFPGARDLLWWWLGRLAWAVGATIGATFVLSWLAVTITALFAASADISIVQRCLLTLLVIVVGFRIRSSIGRSVETMSRLLGNRLAHATGQQARWPTLATGPATGAGFGLAAMARSWALDAPGGQYAYNRLYARHFTRGYRRRAGYPGTVRRAIRQASVIDRQLTDAGIGAARTVARGARAVAMAPVLGPQAYATARARATRASRQARARLQQARQTRQQWRHDVAHPIAAMRRQTTSRPVPPAPNRNPPNTCTVAAARRRAGTSTQVRARVQQAREAHRQRARERGHALQALLDAHREANEPTPPPPSPPHATRHDS